jgi:hypothetical protein
MSKTTDWQPIETAPKDEVHIRGLYANHRVSTNPDVYKKIWEYDEGYVDSDGDFVDRDGEPTGWAALDYTYWRPSLDPPKTEVNGGTAPRDPNTPTDDGTIQELIDFISLQDDLLICYRTGKKPSEKLLSGLEAGRKIIQRGNKMRIVEKNHVEEGKFYKLAGVYPVDDCIVYAYRSRDEKCFDGVTDNPYYGQMEIGFNIADGGVWMPMSDISSESILTEVEFREKE